MFMITWSVFNDVFVIVSLKDILYCFTLQINQ